MNDATEFPTIKDELSVEEWPVPYSLFWIPGSR